MKGMISKLLSEKSKKITIVILPLLILFSVSSCHVGRYFIWNFADIRDYKKFPADTINTGNYNFAFAEIDKNKILCIPEKYNGRKHDFDNFIRKKKTLALLIIRHDTILYENYFSKYNKSKIHPSFSVSKAFISALTGIAIQEGYINNVDQAVTDFLPGLQDTNFNKVTIEDLLNMRSGLDFNESYANPFGKMARFYYGKDLKKYTYDLKIREEPDISYEYQSANAQLLGYIIENATKRSVGEYLEEKLWKPLGMEYYASWSYDSKKNKSIKTFCCLNARARDFAKFGRLYLNNGNWNGKQILPTDWVKKSSSIMNNSLDSQSYHYSYFWRITATGAYFAKGFLGQYIWIYPEKNIIMVRLGKSYSNIDWADFFQQLSEEL